MFLCGCGGCHCLVVLGLYSVAGGGGWFVCGGRVGCSFLTFQKDILDSRKSSETSERKQGNQGEGFSCGVGCQYLIHS